MNDRLLGELFEFLRIPSISSGGGDPEDLVRAGRWLCDKVIASGGEAELVRTPGNPIVHGRLTAARADAPTVMIYGHYDVQSADPPDAWDSPAFEPEIRNERIYARGAADDKGNFYPLLYVACEMNKAGELPVNVRVVMEGEEEIGSIHIPRWVEEDDEGADCVVVFDSTMLNTETPAITVGARGAMMVHVAVRTGARDLHSGMYGGSVLNAIHVLNGMLAEILPGPDGLLRDELREGVMEPDPVEVEAWASLPPGDEVIAEVGGRPLIVESGRRYYRQNWTEPSLDLQGIFGGDPDQVRTIVPAEAHARMNMRLAPGQKAERMRDVLDGLLRAGAPPGTEVTIDFAGLSDPAYFDPGSPALTLSADAIEKACGVKPALVRTGGTIGVLAAWARKGIPVVVTGYALAEDAFHAPNESYRLAGLQLGERTARELYRSLANLK